MIRLLPALALFLPAASFAACPASPSSISAHANTAEEAFAALDAEAFKASMATIAEELGCLEAVIPPGIAAEVHKAHGLEAFLARDLAGATASFRAAAAIDESMSLDPSYAPEGGPLHSAWQEASKLGPSMRIDLPAQQWVDGQRAEDRPKETPYIMQRENGDTFQGVWLTAEAPLPEWANTSGTGAIAETGEGEGEGEDPVGHGAGKTGGGASATTLQLATASGTAILLSGGLFAAALAQEGKFKSDDTLTYDERVDMQKRTNNLGYAAQGIGIVGLGLGATAVFSTRW